MTPNTTLAATGVAGTDNGQAVNAIADYVADNWPMRKYSLEEIDTRLRAIPASVAATSQPSPAPGGELDVEADRRLAKAQAEYDFCLRSNAQFSIPGRVAAAYQELVALVADLATLPLSSFDGKPPFGRAGKLLDTAGDCITAAVKPVGAKEPE